MSEHDQDNMNDEKRPLTLNENSEDHSRQQQLKKKKIIRWSLIGGGVLIAIILIIVLSVTLTKKNKPPGPPGPSPPAPPSPVNPMNYQEFNNYNLASQTTQDWNINIVLAQKSSMQEKLMMVENQKKVQDAANHKYQPVDPSSISNDANNQWASNVQIDFALVDNYQAQVIVYDQTKGRNNPAVSQQAFPREVLSFEARFTQVGFTQRNDSFGFNFSNIYNGETLVSTYNRKLLVSDKFSEMGFIVPTGVILGFGQQNRNMLLSNGSYTLWSRGREEPMPTDKGFGGYNGPHIHPFILCQTANKDFFGIFFASSSSMAIEIIAFPNQVQRVVNFITTDHYMEMYFIMRGTAQEIISKYHYMIGYSQMPSYWALGFFQGSDAYKNITYLQNVVQKYTDANFPLEGIIMDNYNVESGQIFTFSDAQYPSFTDWAQAYQTSNHHIIVGIESGISNNKAYTYYNDLMTAKCVVMSSIYSGPLIGQQNMTQVIYPDYFHPNFETFIENPLVDLYTSTQFDGIWLKNTHLYNQVNGEVNPAPPSEQPRRRLDDNSQLTEENSGNFQTYQLNKNVQQQSTYNLPFIAGWGNQNDGTVISGNLDNHTISLNATHTNINNTVINEMSIHNLNGHIALKRYSHLLKNNQVASNGHQKMMVMADSTWSGSGAFGGATITNQLRTWENLRNTISQAMSFSMYGLSNTVVDACGSQGPMDEELCARWAQVAAFLPMARNYYSSQYLDVSTNPPTWKTTDPSEFFNYNNFTWQITAQSAFNQRIQYTRYIYSQMYKVYREGGPLVYPMLFDFPEDINSLFDIQGNVTLASTFMLGEAIKVCPVLQPGVSTYEVYFPEARWLNLNNFSEPVLDMTLTNKTTATLTASNAHTNIYLKEGKIIPFQLNANQYKTMHDFLFNVKMSFVIFRDGSQYAEGFSLVDDGVSVNSWVDNLYTFWKIRYAEKSINFWVDYGDFNYTLPEGMTVDQLEQITIGDAKDLADTDFACYLGRNLNPVQMISEYNPYDNTLTIKPNLTLSPNLRFADIGFIKFGSSLREPNFCDATSFTYQVTANKQVNDTFLMLNISSIQGTKHLPALIVTVLLMDDQGTINVNITSADDFNGVTSLWRPNDVATPHLFPQSLITKKLSQFFSFTMNPFSYTIFVQDTPAKVLYQSDPNKLYFSDYLVFDSGIFSMNAATNYPLLGMGERAGSLFYSNEQGGIHSRWTFDQANPIDDGLPPGRNMYGYQPMYMYQSNSTDFIGVFDLNSYATDYVLYFNGGTNTQITKIVIGGMIQKYFFKGAKPDDVITLYEKLVGMPTMPPFWAFGWQQCRFGWTTDEVWWGVVQNYTAYDLPLDTMWADIDYMDDYKIFTISPSRYGNLTNHVKDIRANRNMTFVPIMDVGVATRPNEGYEAYDEGIKQDIFIKQATNDNPLTAGVWCGNAYFPDFYHTNSDAYWQLMFSHLNNDLGLEFDGIWLDMNEATNFCNGYCIPSERPTDSLRNKPYYVPGWRDLEDKALGVDGRHYNNRTEYDVHNMFSLMQVKATNTYLTTQKQLRPFVLSRSNFPGMGKFGYHWIGDNWSTVDYMSLSVDGLYSYQLFGLPFMGSDICGFDGNAPADLCTRWHQLGSLYPFARNHNQNATTPQEPYRFNQTYKGATTYTDLIRVALRNRYSFIKYYYSEFYDISAFGGSFFKPLFYEFASDPLAYQNLETNILLGEALKVSIQTTTLAETPSSFYFPAGTWCQVLPYIDASQCNDSTGQSKILPSTLADYYIHLRGGYMIPFQNGTLNHVTTTKDLTALNTDLIILPNSQNSAMSTSYTLNVQAAAIGYIYFDDGVSLNTSPTRFDIIYHTDGANAATITVNMVLGNAKNRMNLGEEAFGIIKVLYTKNCGMAGATKATVTKKDSTTAVVTLTYNAQEDSLWITMQDPTSKMFISLYDIDHIAITAS